MGRIHPKPMHVKKVYQPKKGVEEKDPFEGRLELPKELKATASKEISNSEAINQFLSLDDAYIEKTEDALMRVVSAVLHQIKRQ